MLLRPPVKAFRAPLVTQIACRSVAHVLRERLRLHPTYKRPNDVLVGGKKICGVLVEAQGRSNGILHCLVIGIGLNVNSKLKELVPGATSIIQETGRRQPRPALLKFLLKRLRKDLQGW